MRADNVSLAKLDFAKLRSRLVDLGIVPESILWTIPTQEDFDASQRMGRAKHQGYLTDVERPAFLRKLRREKLEAKAMKDTVELDPIPEINGMRYFRVLKRLHEKLKPDWYLEVGTFTGKSLSLASCNTISVDPEFKIAFPVINSIGKQMFFFNRPATIFSKAGSSRRTRSRWILPFWTGCTCLNFFCATSSRQRR
jgi:hypothetical protein